jgi:hypothetical protein
MCGLYFCETVRFFVCRNFVNSRASQGYNIHAIWSKCDVCHPFVITGERELDPSSSKGILPTNIIPLRLVSFEIINVPKGSAPDSSIFGKDSLFNRICRTITSGGSDRLAANLTRETPLSLEEIRKRAELQKEIAAPDWRMDFLALGERNCKKIDSAAVAEAMQKVSQMEVPGWFGSPISLVLGWLAIIGIIGSVVLSICSVISINIPMWWVMLQYMVVFFVCKQTLDKIDSNGGKLRHQLIAYSQILRLIAQRNFQSQLGREMQESLADALPSFAQLEKILKGYDRRGNFLGLFFTDAFMLSDFFLVRSFLKWKNTYMVRWRNG